MYQHSIVWVQWTVLLGKYEPGISSHLVDVMERGGGGGGSFNLNFNPGQNYVGQACRMHCLDHRSVFHMETNVLWAKSYFPPLPPCNVVRKERLADQSSNIASGGKGGASENCSNSGKRHFVPHILAMIVYITHFHYKRT